MAYSFFVSASAMSGTDKSSRVFMNQFVDDVINIGKIKYDRGIINGNRQVSRDVITKGGYGTVVIGATPFAEYIGKTIYQSRSARFRGMGKQDVLASFFASAVGRLQFRLI